MGGGVIAGGGVTGRDSVIYPLGVICRDSVI